MAEEKSLVKIENCPKDLLLFRAAVRKIFRDISESVSEDEFTNTWTILKGKRRIARQLYASMIDAMCKNMEDRMDEFIEDTEFTEKFNTLRRISEESNVPEDHVAWRPPGDVKQHLRSLDAEKYKKYTEKLEAYVTKVEADNQKLVQKVAKGRAAAKHVDQKADLLLDQRKRVRSEFEKTAEQLERDIKKMHT